MDAREFGEQRPDLLFGQHARQPDRLLGPPEAVELGQLGLEHLPIKERAAPKGLANVAGWQGPLRRRLT
jgi:hypothetical protein